MHLTLKATQIWFYQKSVDFRKSIDGLAGLIHAQMGLRPDEGIFVFHNRGKDKLKLLAWHGNGFVLLYKRLEKGKFTVADPVATHVSLDEKQLSWLLAGLDWDSMRTWNTLNFDDYS